MTIEITNQAWAQLAANVLEEDTTISVVDAYLFPDISAVGDYFYGTLVNLSNIIEIVKVTDITGNVLTVERGAEGTTPIAFSIESRIELRVTAATVYDLLTQNQAGAEAAQIAAEAAAASVINNLFWMGVATGTADAVAFTADTGGVVSPNHFFVVENTQGENAGNMTFQLNTETPLPLRSATGEEIPPGGSGKTGSKMIVSINAAESNYVLLNAAATGGGTLEAPTISGAASEVCLNIHLGQSTVNQTTFERDDIVKDAVPTGEGFAGSEVRSVGFNVLVAGDMLFRFDARNFSGVTAVEYRWLKNGVQQQTLNVISAFAFSPRTFTLSGLQVGDLVVFQARTTGAGATCEWRNLRVTADNKVLCAA